MFHWAKKGENLERWREIILEKPELDRCFGMSKNGQHHYSETDIQRVRGGAYVFK